ncbi:phospholipase D1/2 [Duganella sp. CF458]|uniref:phospholipase D-like domain-containing protein n=1 Tax=Duganella sp. CF458 TaxID=1884368 RepID=UPI0008E1FD33|nr:phospholipase D-like domain-containing protein [Duganella sp. CF458]SFG57716.1 phospholipase D1/2 [Duganella sp. CF458]
MNDALPLEAQLSLYGDTMCRDTGQYFCNARPFSNPRFGNKVSLLSCGKSAFREMCSAMRNAKRFIWIADWQMSHDVELARSDAPGHPFRLHQVIEDIIKSKPVHVRVLIYKSINDTIPGTYDDDARDKLESLNQKGYPGTVSVLLQSPTTAQNDGIDYSHHQKFVVVDGITGFIGGIDLANGRWETPNFDVVVDPLRFKVNEMYNPGAMRVRGANTFEKRLIEDYSFSKPWGGVLLDEGCQPRMPWQDVHVKLEGPSVVDIHRNFVRRWNMTFDDVFWFNKGRHATPIDKDWLTRIKAWDVLQEAQQSKAGSTLVQIVRSVSNYHLHHEGPVYDDLELYADARERKLWRECLPKWKTTHQNNILNAVVNCIRSADNYIYIETQFFISGFGRWGKIDSRKVGNEDNGIRNQVGDELAKRICFHIKAKTPFHVYLVVPAHPEGAISTGSVWKQQWLALGSIKHGTDSVINQVKKQLKAVGRPESDWNKYLTVLNMRNFGATVQYARDPVTNNEDFNCEIGRYVVSEQIYIHSKLLIVDDAVAIIGSANTNDRSLTGNGDTEIAAVIVDTEDVQLRDLGSPHYTVRTRKFARELRRQLWTKHFGFMIDSEDYFRSTQRATRARVSVPMEVPHPPRRRTAPDALVDITKGVSLEEILDKPCAPDVVKAIQAIAAHNRRTYEAVFTHTPRNFRKFDAGLKHFTLPYPLSVDLNSSYSLARLDDPLTSHFDSQPMTEERKTKINATKEALYNYEIAPVIKEKKHVGVVPPKLQPEFMTKKLARHQVGGLKQIKFGRRQQIYDDGTIHDVDKAIMHLQNQLIGFFVEAPLNWGMETEVNWNPTKETAVGIDVADIGRMTGSGPNRG